MLLQGAIITLSTLSTNTGNFTDVFRALVEDEDCYAGCHNADHVCLIETGIEGGQNIQDGMMGLFIMTPLSLRFGAVKRLCQS